MGGLHRASGQACSAAMTTSNSGIMASPSMPIAGSMGLIAPSKSPDDMMLVPRVWMEPREDDEVMGSEPDEPSLRSVKVAGMGMSVRAMCIGFVYMSSSRG